MKQFGITRRSQRRTDAWQVIYMDLMTIIMVFFVILWSINQRREAGISETVGEETVKMVNLPGDVLFASGKSKITGEGRTVFRKLFKDETGITVFLQNEWNEYSFTPAQETQVYRIIQEALTNVRKHSNACTVRILLHNLDDNSFNVLIEDDGLGFVDRETNARPGENMGLNIMRERAGRLHGEVSIETEAGEGTRVCLAFPVNPDEQQGKQRFGENRRAGTTH